MSADYLIHILTPCKIADLASGVYTVQLVAICRVPEANTSVSSSTSRYKKATLVG